MLSRREPIILQLVASLLIAVADNGTAAYALSNDDGTNSAELQQPIRVSILGSYTAPAVGAPFFAWDVAVVPDDVHATDVGAPIHIQVQPDQELIGAAHDVYQTALGATVVTGTLEDDPLGTFTLVAYEEVVVGTIQSPSSNLFARLRYAGGGQHVLSIDDPNAMPPCGGADVPPVSTLPKLDEPQETSDEDPGRSGCAFPPAVWDVMIVYTPAARAEAGGTSGILALTQLAIVETNQAYARSALDVRGMRLVYADEIAYTEIAGDLQTDLARLRDDGDGHLDDVHTLRDDFHADLVCLWVTDAATVCGIAHCSADEDSAFSVVDWSCATGYYSFAHELGHNQGCAHDRANAGSCGASDYSVGWRWLGDSGQQWRTVMAYAPGLRIQQFSNPDVWFDGEPTGVPVGNSQEAHNALTIFERRGHVQNFRTTRFDIWLDFAWNGFEYGTYAYPYNSLQEGVNSLIEGHHASELPILWIKAGSTPEALSISKPMTIRSCGGTVTIGECP